MSEGLIRFLDIGSNLINFKKKFFDPIFVCKSLIFDLNRIGIFGIFTKPSVKALKYNPVPPTRIGFFFFFLYL